MKKLTILLSVTLLVAVVFVSCKKEVVTPDPAPPASGDKNGIISGTVFSANGITPMGGVHVYLNDGLTYTTHTGKSGVFSISAPAGHYDLHIETGDGSLFGTVTSVDVAEKQSVIVPPSETRLLLKGTLAYIPGVYDKIEAIVHDSLGYDITMISASTCAHLDSLNLFNAVFINCGAADLYDSASYANLASYVNYGRSLYVSDYGCSYLLGIYGAGSCIRPFGFIEDSLLCTNKNGPLTMVTGASIVDPAVQTALGATTMDIFYDLPGWEMIQNYNTSFWDVIVSDPTYGALMLRNTSYSAYGGEIYFTTFHNNPNGAIGPDMENILQYVIVNL